MLLVLPSNTRLASYSWCIRIRLRSRNQENNGWKGADRDQRIREENGEFEKRNNSETSGTYFHQQLRMHFQLWQFTNSRRTCIYRLLRDGEGERERETIEGEAEKEKSIWKRGGGVNETSINIKINLDCHFVGRAAPDAATWQMVTNIGPIQRYLCKQCAMLDRARTTL